MQDLLERRCVVAGRLRGLLGHLLETNDLVSAAAGQRAKSPTSSDVTADPGVHQPVAHPGGRQKQAGQLGLGELAAAFPIHLRFNVFGQSQDGTAVGSHGEAEL